MTRTPIPPHALQSAINAANDCRRIATALTSSATHQELVIAELARVRAMNELRSLAPIIREAKRAVQKSDREHAADRAIVNRDRAYIDGLELPA